MRQKFDGQPLNIRDAVPNYFEYCLQSMGTPDSACPLLYEFVIEPFALEEEGCRRGGRRTSSDPRRMRPYSDAVAVASTTTTTEAVATTVTAEQPGEPSCCSARPLAIGIVAVSMSFALIYFLMIVPMTTSIIPSPSPPPDRSTTIPPSPNTPTHITSTTPIPTESIPPNTTVDPLYQFIDNKMHRLQIPQIHIPLLYEVKLKLFLPWRENVSFGTDNFAVEGHVRVHFVSGGGSRVLLHSDSEQHIGDCVVRDEFGRDIFVKHVGRGHSQVLDLHLAADMIHGMNYTLDVAFRGHIRFSPQGMFAWPYYHNNETRYVVATHLQLAEARTVFPCIDTPEVKAQFDTVIIHPTGTTAAANMMENSTTVDKGWTTTTFHRTPPMSTYLFALTVSDYPYLESHSSKGVRSRVYCHPSKIDSAKLLLDSIDPLLGFYEDYFGISYPLEKLDVVILPALEVVAMENWGLITIREDEALYLEGHYVSTKKHQVQEVIAHEIAHQWFGNLVTMKWWNDLWLNEGFASLISVRAIDFLENTTWRYEDNTAELMCQVLRVDQDSTMIPISTNKNVIENLTAKHKTIVYKKASIVIRMIERLVEEDVFRDGLRHFLNTFHYKNADHEDLFNVLTYVHDSSSGGHLSGQNFSLSDVMDTWIRQSHFPLVHVNRKEGSIVTLRQEKYEHVRRDNENPNNQVWKIPIFHDDPVSGKHKVFWVTDKQPTVFDMGGQLVVDPHQLTYMRLRYDMEMYSDITMMLIEDHTRIPTNSRSRLLDDTFAMAEYGQISYKVPFNLSMHLWKETSYRPFQTFSAYLDFFLPRMFLHESWPTYREYLLLFFGPLFDTYKKEGFSANLNSNNDMHRHRDLVFFRACLIGYEPCIQMAREQFGQLRKNCSGEHQMIGSKKCNNIPYYLRQHIYTAAIEHGTDEDFDFLFEKWKSERSQSERERMFTGLCFTDSRKNSDKAWLYFFNNIHQENVLQRAAMCSKKLVKHSLLMGLFSDHKDLAKKLYEEHLMDFYSVMMLVSRQINSEIGFDQYHEIVQPLGNFEKTFRRFIFVAKDRIGWREIVAPYFAGNVTETMQEIKRLQSVM